MLTKLDVLDLALLSLLDKNSNLTTSQLAKTLRQGRDRIEYRIERLLQERVINNFSSIINPHQLGGSIYKIYLKIFGLQRVTGGGM